jgi:hypothetical protein
MAGTVRVADVVRGTVARPVASSEARIRRTAELVWIAQPVAPGTAEPILIAQRVVRKNAGSVRVTGPLSGRSPVSFESKRRCPA